MSDEVSPLPWTTQQWSALRAVALDSARSSRVASTFLPLVGPLPPEQSTVPSNWMTLDAMANQPRPGEPANRLEVRSGKTLHLVTISCNVYLRGTEVADPELNAAKAVVRRAAEVLGRLEDAIVFHGRPAEGGIPESPDGSAIVRPQIYDISGGRDQTGLLQAPDTFFAARARSEAAGGNQALVDFKKKVDEFPAKHDPLKAALEAAKGKPGEPAAQQALQDAEQDLQADEEKYDDDIMSVSAKRLSIVNAVVRAIEKLEQKGHFGPFGVILGHRLFSQATTPTQSLVLPSDRLVEFLDGRRVTRSGTLPADEGVVVALGGQSIELVLARDIDMSFLQVTLEPRYVLRVFEKFVLRIKELDSVCRVTRADTLLIPGFVPRKAES
jgi:uncharacterized linocin/CFP29 family protein